MLIQDQRGRQRHNSRAVPPTLARKEAATRRRKYDFPLTTPLFKYLLSSDTIRCMMAIATMSTDEMSDDMMTTTTADLIADRSICYPLTVPPPRAWRKPAASVMTRGVVFTSRLRETQRIVFLTTKVINLRMKETVTIDMRSSSATAACLTMTKRQHRKLASIPPRLEKRVTTVETSQVAMLMITYLASVIPLHHTMMITMAIIGGTKRNEMYHLPNMSNRNLFLGTR